MLKNVSSFNKETAPRDHDDTIWGGPALPAGMKAPFSCNWGYLEGKSIMEVHEHPSDEVYFVINGKGYCHVGDERFAVKPGDAIEIPPNVMHTMECEEGETFLWIAIWWERID